MFLSRRIVPLLAAIAVSALPALAQQTQPYKFQPVTIVAGGYVPGLVAHRTAPGVIYARTDIGGVYRWNGSNETWTPLTDFHSPSQYNLNGPESIALDPNDPNRLYIAAGMYEYSNCCAFLVSDDRGATFQTYNAPFEMCSNCDGRAAGERLAVNPFKPNELLMGTRLNGLWVSEDYAQTWAQVANFPVTSDTDNYGVQWVVFDPKHPGTIYVGVYTTATVYVSTNDGSTWTSLPAVTWPPNVPATRAPSPERAVLNPDGNLYVTFDDSPGPDSTAYGLVEKYNPQNRSGGWTNITPPFDGVFQTAPRGGFTGITQNPQVSGTVAVTTLNRYYPVDDVYVTQNGGGIWTALAYNCCGYANGNGVDGPAYGNYYFDSSVYGISPYLTFGDTVYQGPPTGYPDPTSRFGWWMSAVLIDPTSPDHLMYGTGATIYGTDNLSAIDFPETKSQTAVNPGPAPTWHVQALGIEETAVLALISPPSGAHLLSGEADVGGFRHDNFAVSPTGEVAGTKYGMFTNPVASDVGSLDWAGQNPLVIVRAQTPGSYNTPPPGCLYAAYSGDGGTTWTPFPTCATGGTYSTDGGNIAVDATGTTIMWSTSYNSADFSTDNGTTWIAASGLQYNSIVTADKVAPQTFYSYYSYGSSGAFYSDVVDTVHGISAFAQVNATPLPADGSCYNSTCGIVVANFAKAGNIWLPLGSNGLWHSTDGGVTWTQITNVPYANSVAIGAAAPWSHTQSVFLYGEASPTDAMAIYRSDNNGVTWVRVNDDQHQYGGPSVIQADPRVFGRVYLGMNGRGIIYGDLVFDDLPGGRQGK
jgi:oligoxyloglucan reducing-end-specific cellobiohydrolase